MQSALKNALKKLPAVEEAVGLIRLAQYRRALREAVASDPPDSGLPPPHLRYRVHRSFGIPEYLSTGRDIATAIAQSFSRAGLNLDTSEVLDLGSGPGRVARWLKSDHPNVQLTCADIDAEAIAWATAHTPEIAEFRATPHLPPLPFEAQSFDGVYCISLFTHLDEAMQNAWLSETRRVLRKGGLLLATTHGELATGSCNEREIQQLNDAGFLFRHDTRRRVKLDGLPDFYQTTFHTQRYVAKVWSEFLDLVEYIPGGIQGHQDLVVLRRKN